MLLYEKFMRFQVVIVVMATKAQLSQLQILLSSKLLFAWKITTFSPKMKGVYSRDSKLRNVRMTLSMLDAKYSKSSVMVDEEDYSGSDMDGDDLIKRNISAMSVEPVEHVPQVESGPNSKVLVEQDHHQNSLDSSQAMTSKLLQPASASEGSPPAVDKTSLDTDSSIESVKTDSILGFTNVHSVSSLADSVPRSDKNEQRMSISLLTAMQKLQPESSSASAGINYVSIISNKDRKEPFDVTSWSTSSLESIQKLMTQTQEKSVENTNNPLKLEQEFLPKEEPIGFHQSLSLTSNMCEQDPCNDGEHTTKNSVWITPDRYPRKLQHCICNERPKLKRKSTAVQTQFLGHQDMQSSVLKNISKGNKLTSEYSVNTPAFKATKLPLFLNDISHTSQVGLDKGLRPEPSSSIENELSELISHHLYLTKEFLERQHRMYMANCRAVQLLEDGYKEKMRQGI
ncbi:uncharacterized protein LOC117652135 [Thrips palmi]|uniref:Uncharacterized protein LOC117652135 n=1 Tax=Thrips palmi TaxID=161013 RepID=A0A6P9A5B4_THRPL|nr:uncharacterized protein LOC117652135 [Thrips palmi]